MVDITQILIHHTKSSELQRLSSSHEVLRTKRERGGWWAFILSQKRKGKKNDVNIARAVLTKKNKFKKQIEKKELFNGPCRTSDTECCNKCLFTTLKVGQGDRQC